MFSGAMDFACLVEIWALDVWWSYGFCMRSEAMIFECLVELWALNVWWSYGLWIYGGTMGFGCLVELWALNLWWSFGLWMFSFQEIKGYIIEKEQKLFITTDHTLNISE